MALARGEFVRFLDEAIEEARCASAIEPLAPAKQPLLNGLPYRLFRQSVALEVRRSAGTFFSGPELARRLAGMLRTALGEGAIVMDPTCGIGDLLLGYAALLPLGRSLQETVSDWGRQLAGLDLRPELVRMAKLRLVTLARARGGFRANGVDIDGSFPLIRVGDMLANADALAAADGFLFNPPFGQTSDHDIAGWSSGQVNSAAIFLARLAACRRPGSPIAAVLPEVLRCGSRYENFRRHLEELGLGGSFASAGRFDSWTDVDVFVTLLENGLEPKVWPCGTTTGNIVGDHFIIRVGPVVPHRHSKTGPWRRYLCAKTTPAWSAGFEPANSRRFAGTVFKPPFVVVRRTSSPSDRLRCVGTIIVGERDVAVENHLLLLIPKNGSLDECQRLLTLLGRSDTNRFLNETIRCRHLTVSSVSSIPWSG